MPRARSSTFAEPIQLPTTRNPADTRAAPQRAGRSRTPRPWAPRSVHRWLAHANSLARHRSSAGRRLRDPSPLAVAQRHAPSFGVHVEPDARRIALSGAMDLAAVSPFNVAAASLTVGRRGRVVVDLQALRFVDAAGLGAFVALSNTLRERGEQLDLQHATPAICRVFGLGGLSELLVPVVPSGPSHDRSTT